MNLTRLLAAGFGAYRVGIMLTQESGPFDVFEKLRMEVEERVERDERFLWMDEGINCPWCVSFWAAILLSPLVAESRRDIPLAVFGSAGIALLLIDQLQRQREE